MTICSYFTFCQIGGNYGFVRLTSPLTVMFRDTGSCLVYLLQIVHISVNLIIQICSKSKIIIFCHGLMTVCKYFAFDELVVISELHFCMIPSHPHES